MNISNKIQLDKYSKQISDCKRITLEQEKELAKKIQLSTGKEKQDAINKLVEANLSIVIGLAIKRVGNYNLDIMDFIYTGNLALLEAAKNYSLNHESKANFSTLAHLYVSNAMNDVRNGLIYTPVAFNHFANVIGRFELEKGAKATPKDIIKLFGVSLKRAKEIRAGLDITVTSTESLATDIGTWEETFGEKSLSIDNMIFRLDLSKFVEKLKPVEKEVINLMYLNGGMGYSEVGRILNRSKQNTEQIAHKAIRKIKTEIVASWNKEHKTRINILTSKNIELLRKFNLKELHRLLEKEEVVNRKIYKEILAHYLVK